MADHDEDRAPKRPRGDAPSPSPRAELPLYMTLTMIHCARSGCVPCRHVLLNTAGEHAGANARPESCPRYTDGSTPKKSSQKKRSKSAPAQGLTPVKRLGLYTRGQSVLTVGDGDFTFSLALARAFGRDSRIVATSHETRASLLEIYGAKCAETLEELESLGVVVEHGVDAGDLAGTLKTPAPEGGFDRLVWNFPCVARNSDGSAQEAALTGSDARSAEELEENRALVARFCAGAARLAAPNGGEIHVTHKVGMQCDWSIEKAADTAQGCNMTCAGSVVFDRMAYPAYRPRKALVKKSFPVTDARTFVFTNASSSTTLDESSKLVCLVTRRA